ncbi:MAG: endo-1,4-beta-xylanase [Candidatus Marinimicrobia bacterium]|nr:endo-1,4-beta-xylanase [Candidatus Neomarinimicrobiota bacterium]
MADRSIIFKPGYTQTGYGPHLGKTIYAFDKKRDTFYSDIKIIKEGIAISDTGISEEFGIVVRWNVEGYGFLKMFADNGGEFYRLPKSGSLILNLNHELAKSRIKRNEQRLEMGYRLDWKPSSNLEKNHALAKTYHQDAGKHSKDSEYSSILNQKSLLYGLIASELIELEIIRFKIEQSGHRPDFMFGCDARGYFQMDQNLFFERFMECFNYSTITHYLIGDTVDFEAEENNKQFSERDHLLDELLKRGVTVEGRPLFWTHTWVTPEWLKNKAYADVLRYVAKHVKTVLDHYGDRILIWEIVNELHDWANELELNHKQTIEITKLACEVARSVNPKVRLLINNCCPFGEYVQTGKWTERPAKYPQRTPMQYLREVETAGVDYDIIGAQMYFTKYPLADAIQILERYEEFGKKIQIAEIGSPSHGISQEFIEPDIDDPTQLPYEWHRHWDEDLQADWLEAIFSYGYSRPMVEAANWYDFVDPFSFLKHGGILRSPKGERKAGVRRLIDLKKHWSKLK